MTRVAYCLHLSTTCLAAVLSTRCQLSLLLTCLSMSLVSNVSGLACIQCVSMDTTNCLHGDMTPTPCVGADTGSAYCLKSVGTQVYGHGHFVFRTCSKSLQTNCTLTLVEGEMYNICHDSCVKDGCNMASTTAVSITTVGLICFLRGL